MSAPSTPAPRPILSWGIATALVALAALALLLWASWQPVAVAPANPAASVMVVFAAQAMSPETRQAAAAGARRSAAASAARPPDSATRQEAVPVLARAAAPDIVAAEKAAQAAASPSPEPTKETTRETSSVPAQASSSATPAPSPVRGPQAAPFDSDTPPVSAAPASWQSRVLSHLARFKRYPGDARQRKRAGAAWVRFQVDRDGKLLASELVTSSGTVLLDREALQVLQRAQPLPAPPGNVLHQGTVTVTLPVSFKLETGQDQA